MNIKFQIKISFIPTNEERKYCADVVFLLPKEPGNNYVAEVYQCRLGEHYITQWVGEESTDPKFKKVSVYFYGSGIESLEEEVIEEIMEYRRAVKRNLERILKAREYFKEIEIEFPDLP